MTIRYLKTLAWVSGLFCVTAFLGCGSESSAPPAVGGEGSGEEGGTLPEDSESTSPDGSEEADASGTEGETPVEAGCTQELEGCTTLVCPSNDDFNNLQNAIIATNPGDVVCLGDGTFNVGGRLTVGTAGLVIRGAGQGVTRLNFANQVAGTKAFLVKAHGVRIEDLSIENYIQDGIVFEACNDWSVAGVEVTREFAPGPLGDALRAVGGKRGRIEWSARYLDPEGANPADAQAENQQEIGVGSVFAGATGAGVHFLQTRDTIARGNFVSRDNAIGAMVISGVNNEIRDSRVLDNAAGVLMATGLETGAERASQNRLSTAVVGNNNAGESRLPTEGAGSWIPAGTGLAVIAASQTEVSNCSFQGNDGYALFLLSHLEIHGFPGSETDGFNPYNTGTFVHDNVFDGNGLKPKGLAKKFPASPPVPSMATDGCYDETVVQAEEDRNCFMNNIQNGNESDEPSDAPFVYFDACNEFTQIAFSTEDALANCELESLPPVDVELIEVCDNGQDDDDDGAVDCEDGDCYDAEVCAGVEGPVEETGEAETDGGGATGESGEGETN